MFPGGSGVHPQRKCVRKQPLLFAGGPPAPALRGVDRRHRENLLQKSPPGGEGGERFLNLAFPLLLRNSIPGGHLDSPEGLALSREAGDGGGAVSLP